MTLISPFSFFIIFFLKIKQTNYTTSLFPFGLLLHPTPLQPLRKISASCTSCTFFCMHSNFVESLGIVGSWSLIIIEFWNSYRIWNSWHFVTKSHVTSLKRRQRHYWVGHVHEHLFLNGLIFSFSFSNGSKYYIKYEQIR